MVEARKHRLLPCAAPKIQRVTEPRRSRSGSCYGLLGKRGNMTTRLATVSLLLAGLCVTGSRPAGAMTPEERRQYLENLQKILPDNRRSFVLRHTAFGYESPGENWLALHPALGYEMGWTPANEGLFAWVDGTGAKMVESVWWLDGHLQHRPPHLDDEVGEGWSVIASSQAWQALHLRYPKMKCKEAVKRTFLQDRIEQKRELAGQTELA